MDRFFLYFSTPGFISTSKEMEFDSPHSAMKKIIILVFLCVSINVFGQIGINYEYRPGLNELETELSYNFKSDYVLGIRYTQNINYFKDLTNPNLTYVYIQLPIIENLKFEFAGAFWDFEYCIVYNTPTLQFSFGRSHSDIIIFNICYYKQLWKKN